MKKWFSNHTNTGDNNMQYQYNPRRKEFKIEN